MAIGPFHDGDATRDARVSKMDETLRERYDHAKDPIDSFVARDESVQPIRGSKLVRAPCVGSAIGALICAIISEAANRNLKRLTRHRVGRLLGARGITIDLPKNDVCWRATRRDNICIFDDELRRNLCAWPRARACKIRK